MISFFKEMVIVPNVLFIDIKHILRTLDMYEKFSNYCALCFMYISLNKTSCIILSNLTMLSVALTKLFKG